MEAVAILLVINAVLYALGVFNWLAMAMSFVVQQRGERGKLTVLRWKLGFLTALAREIGRTERRLDELDRER